MEKSQFCFNLPGEGFLNCFLAAADRNTHLDFSSKLSTFPYTTFPCTKPDETRSRRTRLWLRLGSLSPCLLFPRRQHTVRVSGPDTVEQGSDTVPVGTVTKGNSIGQAWVSPCCTGHAKSLANNKLLLLYFLYNQVQKSN